MTDPKALQDDLQYARQARIDAEAAVCEVEALLDAVQHFQPGKQRWVFMVDCGDPEQFGPAH